MRKFRNFVLYYEEYQAEEQGLKNAEIADGFTAKTAKAIEKAMYGFVKSDVKLAVELIFVDEEEIRRLNRELRQTDKVTDVLSFPALDGIKGFPIKKKEYANEIDEEGNLCIGSIAICCERAREQAEEYNHSYNRELHYLIVHGIMHCLGYDHEIDEDKAEMREKEEYILKKLGVVRENS
ncbi:MAG: rRNA maturation RNase YbeY [Clostridia bacterium]|nr:rRNA maturation RNase YbeY [Clostridia bacterium]